VNFSASTEPSERSTIPAFTGGNQRAVLREPGSSGIPDELPNSRTPEQPNALPWSPCPLVPLSLLPPVPPVLDLPYLGDGLPDLPG